MAEPHFLSILDSSLELERVHFDDGVIAYRSPKSENPKKLIHVIYPTVGIERFHMTMGYYPGIQNYRYSEELLEFNGAHLFINDFSLYSLHPPDPTMVFSGPGIPFDIVTPNLENLDVVGDEHYLIIGSTRREGAMYWILQSIEGDILERLDGQSKPIERSASFSEYVDERVRELARLDRRTL